MGIERNLLAMLFAVAACDGVTDDAGGPEDDPTDPTGGQPQGDEADDTAPAELARMALPILRGVDRAGVFSVGEAKTLHNKHGVRWTGVYIGGPCSGGFGWTKSKVAAIAAATHWRFMPIYVGQQASSICGAHHLTRAQGKADGIAAAKHMHDFGWGRDRDIPVALDVEAATYFNNVSASTAYVRGWVNAVHHAGYRAYVYGSPFGLAHYRDAHVRIDAAWAASFFFHGFKRVKPGQLDQMGNRFRHSNRAWQYAGNFGVSGAGTVDASTSHLLLAPEPGGTNRVLVGQRNVPESCGALQIGEGLERGESIASCDGTAVLSMSATGELSLAMSGHTRWTAGTEGSGAVAVLQDTGELDVFDAAGNTVFSTDTQGFDAAHATLDAQGLRLVDEDATLLWSDTTGTLVDEDLGADLSEGAFAE
jgi:hypothetical protein